jgi:hypothetical protein
METSTAPTLEKFSGIEDNWKTYSRNPSPSALAWTNERNVRDTAVGAVLHEMHCLEVSQNPIEIPTAYNLDQMTLKFWVGYAMNCPGYELDKLKAELLKRKTAFSVAISPLKAF